MVFLVQNIRNNSRTPSGQRHITVKFIGHSRFLGPWRIICFTFQIKRPEFGGGPYIFGMFVDSSLTSLQSDFPLDFCIQLSFPRARYILHFVSLSYCDSRQLLGIVFKDRSYLRLSFLNKRGLSKEVPIFHQSLIIHSLRK